MFIVVLIIKNITIYNIVWYFNLHNTYLLQIVIGIAMHFTDLHFLREKVFNIDTDIVNGDTKIVMTWNIIEIMFSVQFFKFLFKLLKISSISIVKSSV